MAKDKRSKPQMDTIKVTSLSEADSLLRQISDINARLRGLESAVDIAMNELKEDMKLTAQPMIEEKERLEKSLAIYAEYNKGELFNDKKTIELTFGLFGYRQSTSIGVKASTLELLRKHGFIEAIVTKETPNKDVMRDWSTERLGLVDAKRVVEDKFWVEAKQNDTEVK
jgi:phage host-nuclease inhibitor protein Gam